jgi:hypothetical protein
MGTCSTSHGDIFDAERASSFPTQSVLGAKTIQTESERDKASRESREDLAKNDRTVGTIGVINYVVRGLERVPGRKLVFLLSDGLSIRSREGEFLSAKDVLWDVAECANRSSAVINTIDVRGLVNEDAIDAKDEVYVQDDVRATDKISADRRNVLNSTSDGLAYLAAATGGKFSYNENYVDVPIRRALASEQGYYLLAYEPADETFKGKGFHSIDIRVNMPGLSVRSRPGFYGFIETTKRKGRSESSDLYEAIAAPLPDAALDLRLTAFYVNTSEAGNVVRSLIQVPGDTITLADDGSMKKATLDVAMVTLDEKNHVVDEFTRSHTFRIDAAATSLIRKNGLIYTTDVPIKKAGTYNFRVAVKDVPSKAIGSAVQIIDIPDPRKKTMFMAGLTMTEVDQNGKFVLPTATKAEEAISLARSSAVPAIRRFRAGSILAYAYTIYNAQLDASDLPKIAVTVNLYRDGQVFTTGTEQASHFEKQNDWSRISDYGYMRLRPEMQPGEYVLQIIVKDLNSSKKAISTQSVDFEVTE